MPCRTRRDSVLPKPAVNRKAPRWAAISSRCSREATVVLMSACARSSAAAWVKCTTYTGLWRVDSSSSSVSCSGVIA